jgi:hypothetical protein
MTLRAIRFFVALVAAVAAGLLVTALAEVSAANDTPPAGQIESSSPSQEVRERINKIRRNEFFYQSFGRSDPFASLVGGEYEPLASAELVDLNSAQLVGVMWGSDDRFGLVEDGDGFGYILRVGDRVRNGRVTAIRKDQLTARVTLYGISNNVILKIERTEG